MKKIIFLLTFVFCQDSFAQWSGQGIGITRYGNGAAGPAINQWRSYGFGNFAAAGAIPEARIHLSEFYLLSPWTGTNGDLFRTDGFLANANHWSMFTGSTAATATEKFRITTLASNSEVEMGTVPSARLYLITNNQHRISILGNSAFPFNRTGFVGFNNDAPLFHVDINTQNPAAALYGELMLRARITDDPDAYISFLNIATTGAVLSPALMGRQSNNGTTALSTVGSIVAGQDIAVNPDPVTRFFSALNYDPTQGTFALARLNVLQNRRLFGWYNGVDQLMDMEASGYLGVGTNNPGNRVEINSDFYDPATGNPLGTPGNGPLVTASTLNGQPGVVGGATGFSGLRFSDLTANSVPIATNPGQGVLAVDGNGDVIYVSSSSSTGLSFGAVCGDTINGVMTSDLKETMNNYNFYFEGNDSTLLNNNVGFGWQCGQPLKAKVDAFQLGIGGVAGSFVTQENYIFSVNNLNPTGARGISNGNGNGAAGFTGLYGMAIGQNSLFNYGVFGSAANSPNVNRAGYFDGLIEITNGSLVLSDSSFKTNVNSFSSALKIVSLLDPKSYFMDTVNYSQFNFDSKKQYGFISQEVENVLPELVHKSVHPGAYDSFGNLIGQPTEYKSLNYNAIIPINTQAIKELNTKFEKTTLSDQSIKTNVSELSGSLDKVLDMRGVSYNWNGTAHPNLSFDSTQHIGFIAQEINTIDSRLTYIDEDSLMHVEYDKIVPVLAEAIEELNQNVESKDSIIEALQNENETQQSTIDDLNERLTQLENCLSGILPMLCQMNHSPIQTTQEEMQNELRKAINVQLSDKNAIVLNQNVPNPFAESTVITYSIPATVQKAQIHFYDGTGKMINSVEITERGNGQLNVFANDLSTGFYTYSLVADGKIVATKRMVKE